MKKLVIGAAALACASVVSAQTVTSANIVGYNKAVSAKGLQLLATQFDNDSNTVGTIFGDSLPSASAVSVYVNGSGYQQTVYTVNFLGVGSWSNPDLEIGTSTGYWLQIPDSAPEDSYTTVISGEVPMDAAVTNSIGVGLNLLAYPYPAETSVSTAGFDPVNGDSVSVYVNGSGYQQSVYTVNFLGIGSWSEPDMILPIGAGFWYNAAATQEWVSTRPFSGN